MKQRKELARVSDRLRVRILLKSVRSLLLDFPQSPDLLNRHCRVSNPISCYGGGQTLTSPSDSVSSCLVRIAHARFASDTSHCLVVASASVVRQCAMLHRGRNEELSADIEK